MRKQLVRRTREKGVATLLWLGFLSLVFIILPMIGLAIDVGFVYAIRAKMQAAVDGAALAAARALSIGATLASQETSAQNNAVTWFNANFPSNFYGIASVSMSASNVTVATDPNNAQLMDVTVSATAQVNTIFMRWFGQNTVLVGATGKASRRAVVAVMVLDRSGSMCWNGSTYAQPCTESTAGLPCATMISAAKQFTGQFAEGSDYIGLISFSDDIYIHSLPTTSFQSTLGYTNSSGSGTGDLDNVACYSGTNTATAMSMAYQILEQTNLPGALNVIVLETDGLPNSLLMNFYNSSTNTTALVQPTLVKGKLTGGSSCTDSTGKTLAQGGFGSSAVIPQWMQFSMNFANAPFVNSSDSFWTSSGPFSTIPSGMVGVVESADPGEAGVTNEFSVLMNYWSKTTAQTPQSTGSSGDPFNAYTAVSTPGCAALSNGGSPQWVSNPTDLAYFPPTDVFGNQLNPSAYTPYETVTMNGTNVAIPTSGANEPWQNWHNGVINATDYSAYQARTNTGIPITVFAIGLGGNTTTGPPDPILLQRMANDPNGDEFNNPAEYQPCADETGCATFSSQPQGTFVYAPTAANLSQAFLRISSQVLRLSK
jgi:Flp pilus assembly protein TadG